MKYHINKKGEVSICLAVFKNCPYTEHFNSFSEGQDYMDNWEDNKETYSELKNEDILKPENNFMIEAKNFKNKELLKTVDINDNSLILLLSKNNNRNEILKYISNNIDKNLYSIRKLFKAHDSVDLGLDSTNDLNKDRLFNRFKDKDLTITNIMECFDYSISDVVLSKNTKLRIFNLNSDPEYNFNPNEKIYASGGGSYV